MLDTMGFSGVALLLLLLLVSLSLSRVEVLT